MTQKKDLKRRIRERMAKTGESYTAARAHVIEPEPAPPPKPAIAVVEPRDLSDDAARLGLKCRVYATQELANPVRALERLRDALVETAEDPELAVIRAAVLHGRPPPRVRWSTTELRQFLVRVRAGIAGTAPGGWLLAYVVDGRTVLCSVSAWRASGSTDVRALAWLRDLEHAASDEIVLAGIPLRPL